MLTTPEEYVKYLWAIESTDENGNVENPLNNRPVLSVILPSKERTFDVDMASRSISTPTFLSVQSDHRAETIYFKVDRYYEYQDLSLTSCVIEYTNANGEGGFYLVPFYDISTFKDEEKMLIPWCIDSDVSKYSGTVHFAIRFFKLDETHQKLTYNIRTQITNGQIYGSINEAPIADALGEKEEVQSVLANVMEQIAYKLDSADSTIYWTDL